MAETNTVYILRSGMAGQYARDPDEPLRRRIETGLSVYLREYGYG